MLSKIIMVSNLLMLAKGAIELPLFKESHLSKNVFNSVNRRNLHPLTVDLDDGLTGTHANYVVKITIGNQSYRVIADTGSSVTLLRSEGCVTCVVGTPADRQTHYVGSAKLNGGEYTGQNETFHFTPGTFAKSMIYKAVITIADVQAHDQYVGYIFEHTENLFGSGPNLPVGVLGLAHHIHSEIHLATGRRRLTLMSTLSNNYDFSNTFAMCFNPSGVGGKMIIGGEELAGMQFTSFFGYIHYTVRVSYISINKNNLSSTFTEGLEAVVDTGSSNLKVPEEVRDAIATVICPVLAGINMPCKPNPQNQLEVPSIITVTPQEISTLPSITIKLPGAKLVVPSKSYFVHYDNSSSEMKHYYYGIDSNGYTMPTRAGTPTVVLGCVALMGHWVYFDVSKRRIGLSRVLNCNEEDIPSSSTKV